MKWNSCFAVLCVSLLALLPFSVSASNPNLLQNPGFEQGLEHWSAAPESSSLTTAVNIISYSGSSSACITGMNRNTEYTLSQTVTAPVTATYALRAKVMTFSASNPQTVTMRVISSEGTRETKVWIKDSVWQDITLEMEGRYGLPITVEFSLNGSGSEGFLVDDASLSVSGSYVPAQMLTNEGFENGFSNWTAAGTSANAFTTDAQARSGKQSLYMGYFVSEGLNNCVTQKVPAIAGSYRFSVYVKTENLKGTGVVLFMEAADASGNVLASSSGPSVSDSQGNWVLAAADLSAPAGTQYITVTIAGIYCTGAFYVDDTLLSAAV